ncbi:hypothetical protein Tco_0831437 [Tanacetum coccineum]
MSTLTFADTHNMVAFLDKPAESDGFHKIIDFLNANQICYALTVNPTIYTSCIQQFWATTKAKTVNGRNDLMKHNMFDIDDLHSDEVNVDMPVGDNQEQGVKERDVDISVEDNLARNLQAQLEAEIIEEEKLARKQEEEANIALIESWDNTQAMMEADF